MKIFRIVLLSILVSVPSLLFAGEGVLGYYRYPDLHGETLVFAAEGDLWTVGIEGGLARRLTTHPGDESEPRISPDGRRLAFTATYEGPSEVYTMPLAGGLPERHTWESDSSLVETWTPDGELVYSTAHFATLPDRQLVALNLETSELERIPLAVATEASFDDTGQELYFVRPAFHRNVTKRYRGGTARKIWRFEEGGEEAKPLTEDYDGPSHTPMWWSGRVYFISDRDGTMNLWSMDEAGEDLQQHTEHSGWDIRDASLDGGRIVYVVGADLWLFDIEGRSTSKIQIHLSSDVDQWREKWVENPMQYLTSVRIHPQGESLVLTSRGRVFVAPSDQGRFTRPSAAEGVRFSDAVFMPEGDEILALSDETGELEFVTLDAEGIDEARRLTDDGTILRYEGVPSPDGKWIAYPDHNRDLWILDVKSGEQKVVSTNRQGAFGPSWSPDSQWLTFTQSAINTYNQIILYNVRDGRREQLTSDRVNSFRPVWDASGEWIYFLSDRHLRSLVGAPWGSRQPEPYFDKSVKLYQMSLRSGLRSPFAPDDELYRAEEESKSDEKDEQDGDEEKGSEEKAPKPVEIELAGMQLRVREVPADAGNYFALDANEDALFFLARDSGPDAKTHLMALAISNEEPEAKSLVSDVDFYDLSRDGKKIVVRKDDSLYVFDAGTEAPSDLGDARVDLSAWNFTIDVRQDWRQIFVDAWRLERDHFYDPGMHGLDWEAVRDKYLPLVDRVTTRAELSELIGRAVGELSALHTSVRGGDHREGSDDIAVASLGARLLRDEQAGGYRIDYIYRSDPDYIDELSPLADPDLEIAEGDVIVAINGRPTLSVPHLGSLLRNQAGRQVRLRVHSTSGATNDRIVVPMSNERALRYRDWKYTRRLETETKSDSKIGYVHLSAMGGGNLTEWYREFYPVFDRPGLIVDVRHNNGGNIDSIILEKLMRRAWFYWKGRVEEPYWNMQYAFRGHMVVLCDQRTASDGEAFAEGFRRLGLGKVIGMRTWGGEIWLSSSNRLSDRGIARAPMWGVYDDQGDWLIEQWGVEPDIEVDNLPHATFQGEDAQLQAAIDFLLAAIEEDPREVPEAPPYPDLSFDYPSQEP